MVIISCMVLVSNFPLVDLFPAERITFIQEVDKFWFGISNALVFVIGEWIIRWAVAEIFCRFMPTHTVTGSWQVSWADQLTWVTAW